MEMIIWVNMHKAMNIYEVGTWETHGLLEANQMMV